MSAKVLRQQPGVQTLKDFRLRTKNPKKDARKGVATGVFLAISQASAADLAADTDRHTTETAA